MKKLFVTLLVIVDIVCCPAMFYPVFTNAPIPEALIFIAPLGGISLWAAWMIGRLSDESKTGGLLLATNRDNYGVI